MNNITHRALYRYAGTITRDWKEMKYINPVAHSSVQTMFDLDQIVEPKARLVVLQFLHNANQWRGEVARATKKELAKIANQQVT